MARAFVIRPFGLKKDSAGTEIDFDRIHNDLIGPALIAAGLDGSTTGEIVEAGNIREDMFALILEADLVVCDITILNANVFYELGIRHALRKKSTVLIKGTPMRDGTPFDLLTDRYMPYEIADPADAKDELLKRINASRKSQRDTDSPIFQMLPMLPEVDLSRAQVVPADFREEVERARAAGSKGWLRLLADEVRSRRFGWLGLKRVGHAQWDLEDWEGANSTWELIRDAYPDDVEANLALANVYERQYRMTRDMQTLQRSDQSIERVLANDDTDRKQRAEALSLRGRNQKTMWRLEFESVPTLEARREAAMSRVLIDSFDAYRKAFLFDLNHYWSGIAAAQMGTILVNLSQEPWWADSFDSTEEANAYKAQVYTDVQRLLATVRISIEAELARYPQGSSDRMWAEITGAAARFCDPEARDKRIIDAYTGAIPPSNRFAWDSVRGQLELFILLGVRPELAAKIIETISPRMSDGPGKRKPVHLLLFAGHQVDSPGRQKPRFPAAHETKASTLLRARLESILNEDEEFMGFACAAPGADILAHELCSQLGISSTVCLPMHTKDYARLTFGELDEWRTRFLRIVEQRTGKVLELSENAGLPRWLYDSQTDPWERGNRWVMQIAQTCGASHVTLIALWDKQPQGDGLGGTAHFVQLARDAGNIRIEIIDANELLVEA